MCGAADNSRDVTDILAYQIGGVFFLVVLFMAGTMTRGFFPPGLFKNIKLTVFVLVALIVGFFVYRDLPDISSIFSFDFNKPASESKSPAAVPEPVAPAVAVRRSSAPKPAVKMGEVKIIRPFDDPDPPVRSAEISSPAVVEAPPSPVAPVSTATVVVETRPVQVQDSGNRVKRAAKAIGHALGFVHPEYKPGQNVPTNASPP